MGVPERLDRAAHPQRRDDRVERFGIGPPGGEREFVAVARARHREHARLARAKAHDIARRIGGEHVKIGRAACWESVSLYVSLSVVVVYLNKQIIRPCTLPQIKTLT